MATTFSRMTKKAASFSVIGLSNRTRLRKSTSIFTSPSKTSTNLSGEVVQRTSIPNHHHFSSLSQKISNTNNTILRLIESGIDHAEQQLDDLKDVELPRDFPFEILDNPREETLILSRKYAGGSSWTYYNEREETVTLTRKYQGEDIKVIAFNPHLSTKHNYQYHYEKEVDKDDQQEWESQYVYLDVSVSKVSGQTMKFDVTGNVSSAGIKIDSMDFNDPDVPVYEDHTDDPDDPHASFWKISSSFAKENNDLNRPRFWDMDENLKKSFHTYLEDRGIEPKIVKFLYDSLVRKKKRQKKNPALLKNLKNCFSNGTTSPLMKYTTAVPSSPLKTTIISTSNNTNDDLSPLNEKRSNSDDTLLRLIGSGINSAEEKFHQVVEASREFPFKIEDNPEDGFITLTREYKGEDIKVRVFTSYYDRVCLSGDVSNRSGVTLGFSVSPDRATGGIKIKILDFNGSDEDEDDEFVSNKDKPDFSELDERMQKAFYKYLEVRGIEPNITKFLCHYMDQRKHKRYSMWLKDLKNFFAN